jgi:hypothetical protein
MWSALLGALSLASKMTILGLLLVSGLLFVAAGVGLGGIARLFSFLAETWIIQTFFAAWVAFRLQESSHVNQRRLERLQTTFDRKVEATKSLHSLIERRIYASRRYLDVLTYEPSLVAKEREDYRSAVKEWNESAKVHQTVILIEFAGYYGLQLDNVFFPAFSKIDSQLAILRRSVEAGRNADPTTSRQVRATLNTLGKHALDLVRDMLRETKNDRDILDDRLPVTAENAPRLSYGRLIKALVQPDP